MSYELDFFSNDRNNWNYNYCDFLIIYYILCFVHNLLFVYAHKSFMK